MSTRIHAVVDAPGNPTGLHLTGGQASGAVEPLAARLDEPHQARPFIVGEGPQRDAREGAICSSLTATQSRTEPHECPAMCGVTH